MTDQQKKTLLLSPATAYMVPLPRASTTSDKRIINMLPPGPPPPPSLVTAPLVPQCSATSEKGIPILHDTLPVYSSEAIVASPFAGQQLDFSSSLSILIATIAGILYLAFKPALPKYSIDSLSDLRLNYDPSLYCKFDVKIIANNPNKKIKIYYEMGGG
ncbi:hypothetical protein SLA2020_202930 [Shorea laevis]